MSLLAVAIDREGVVLAVMGQHGVQTPHRSDVCTDPSIAKKIPAFEARKLSPKDRASVINHAKKCRPCSHALGWGDL